MTTLRRLLWLLAGVLLLSLAPAARANEAYHGFCEVGNVPVITSGLTSSNVTQGSFPQCTVTVFVHGGGLATIYSDNNTPPTVLANPFTASTNGQIIWYGANGRYDVQMSGAGFPNPTTISDVLLCDGAVASAGCGGGGGGGGVGPGTPNIIAKFTTPTTVGNSSGFDDGTNVVQWPNGLSIMARPMTELWPNASGGTLASTLVKIVAGQAVSVGNSDDPFQVYGIAFQGAGTSGNVQVAIIGQTPCIFDGQTTQGDQVTMSTTAAPQCHDTGSPDLTVGVPAYGKVVSSNTGAGTIATVDLQLPGQQAFASSGGGGTVLNPFGVTPVTTSYTVLVSDANHDVDITGTAAAQTITLPQPSSNGLSTFVQSTQNTDTCNSVTTCTAPASSSIAVTAGDMLIVQVYSEIGAGTINTPTDTAGDVFTEIGSPLSFTCSLQQCTSAVYFVLHSAGSPTMTFTATVTSAPNTIDVGVIEYHNVVSLDQFAGQSGGVGGITSPAVATTAATELLVGTIAQVCGVNFNPGSGYQGRVSGSSLTDLFMQDQVVGVIGTYVSNLASTCSGGGAAWSSAIQTFIVNGVAPQFGNGFWVWISNHSTQTWTISATSSDIIACAGTSAPTTTLASGAGVWFESDGTNWRTACGQGGGGGGGSGTVTSVATTAPLTGGPITTTGTIACATCTTSAAALTLNQIVLGGGAQATSTLGSLGTTTTVLHGNAAGAPSFAAVTLTTDVTGLLPVANGGSGAGTFTAHGVLLGEGTSVFGVTSTGTTAQPLLSGGAGADPAYGALNLAGVGVTGILPVANLPFTYSGSTTELATASGALTNGHCVSIDASGNFVDSGTAGPCGSGSGGAVTSVALALPSSVFTVTGSPVTVSGTLTGSFNTQTASTVFGNCTGSTATPTFCAITTAMLSGVTIGFNKLSSGTNTTAAMLVGTGASLAATGSGTITATTMPFSGNTAASFTGGALTIGTGGSLAPVGAGTVTATNVTPAGVVNNCVKWGAGGALDDFGAVCSSGGGSSIVVNGGSALASPVNFQTGPATNGITITASNPSGSIVQFAATGTRTIAGGGTSATTALGALTNLWPTPLTTGDILAINAGVPTRVPSTTGCFQATGTGTVPFYGPCATGSLTGSAAVGTLPKMATTTSITSSSLSDNGTTVSTAEPVSTPTVTYTGTGPLIITGTEGSCAGSTAAKDVLCLGDATTHTAQVALNGGAFQQLARVLTGSTASLGGSAIANGTCSTAVATITGAVPGMAVIATPTSVSPGFFWDGFVSGTNTITVRVCNATGSTNSPTASGYAIRVIP